MFKVAIVGNQNVGKTTLFNILTGSSQHVGNFPGTTVSTVEGVWLQNHEVILVDLPGIYSLTPFTQEEQIAYFYLTHQKIDLLLNIIDATICTRSLYLTLQCLDLEYPMIVAVNKMEELKQAQGNLDCQQLALRLNVPCMEINTLTGQGILECMQKGITLQQHAIHLDFYSSNIQYLITQLQQQLSCSFFDCIQYFETGFFPYQLSKKQTLQVENIIQHQKLDSIIAENRYLFIQQLLKDIYQSPQFDLQYRLSQQIDHWILSKYFGFPILSLFFSLVFFLTFGILGPFFNQLLSHLFNSFVSIFTLIFQPLIHPILFSLVVHGIFRGCLSVLNFLPLILLLFFFLSLLEDSGYMARVALLLDSLLKKIDLTGKSFVPLLLGLGCTVPAVLSTRILKDKQEKKLVVLFLPFISCTAKIPIYLLFSFTFFPHHSLPMIMLLYSCGLLLGLTFISIIHNRIPNKEASFLLEIPRYRFPTLKNTLFLLKEKTKEFIQKIFSIILLLNVILWFLQYFTIDFHYTLDQSQSILYLISNTISGIFIPLGFHDWRITTAIISGFSAKEAIISTFALLFHASSDTLATQLTSVFTPISAFSFLLFVLFYTPCIATISITYKEVGLKNTIFMIVFQCFIAWMIAFIFYSIATLWF